MRERSVKETLTRNVFPVCFILVCVCVGRGANKMKGTAPRYGRRDRGREAKIREEGQMEEKG